MTRHISNELQPKVPPLALDLLRIALDLLQTVVLSERDFQSKTELELSDPEEVAVAAYPRVDLQDN